MEGLLALAIIGLFIFIGSLSSRISKLEREVYSLRGAAPEKKDETRASSVAAVAKRAEADHAVAVASEKKTNEPIVRAAKESIPVQHGNPLAWLTKDWPLKVGAVLLLIGFGWFVMYAIANNLVSPEMRIGLGIAAGILFMIYGLLRMLTYADQGSILLVLGAGIALATMYAGVVVYHFFTPFTVLLSTCAVGIVIAGASVRHGRRDLGILSVIVAGIAPFLTNAQTGDIFSLIGYGGVVIAIALTLMIMQGWKEPILSALMVELVYMAVVSDMIHGGTEIMLAYMLLAYAFFVGLTHAWAVVRHGKQFPHDIILSIFNAVISVGVVLAFVPEQLQSVVMLAAAIVTGGFAYFTWAELKNNELMTLYSGIALIFLGIATALEYEGVVLLALFALEAFAAIVLSYLVTGKNVRLAQRVSTTLVASFVVSLQYLFGTHDVHTAYTFFAVACGYACLVYYIYFDTRDTLTPSSGEWLTFLSGVGMYFVFAGSYIFFVPTESFVVVSAVAACLYVFALRLATDVKAVHVFALSAFIVPVLTALQYIGTPFTGTLLVVFLCNAAALLLAGGFVASRDRTIHAASGAALVLSGATFMYIVWHVLTDMIYSTTPSIGVLVALVLYTLFGIASYMYGKQHNVQHAVRVGQALIGFVIIRLLLVDVWNMDLAIRVATFCTIGGLLIATTLLTKERRD